MESIWGMILNMENGRMLALAVLGYFGYVKLTERIEKKIDEKLVAFHTMLKTNDFAHLNQTIEALTFTLEKNGFLDKEDKKYIDTRLDR
ncbi:MAG: hypothetical protein LBC75_02575 [Fibromonadaceae bacterium]|nr:hypothetical protein [Fibromonadaceae bacterium]